MLTSLRLQDFRCFEQLSLELPEQGALFIGDNAQGKTSILEAVCVLVRLQSPRSKLMRPLIRVGTSGYGIAGECWDVDQQVRYDRRGMHMKCDGEETGKQGDYLRSGGLVVWMGNEDVSLVRSSGSGRRRYLDFIASQLDSGYRRALSRYRRALKARNLLLKAPRPREQEISAYSEVLIEHGDYLRAARQRMVEELEPRAAEAQRAVSGLDESLQLEYVSGCGGDMRTALETTAESELRQRQTLAGPHRDDMRLLLNGMPADDYASEGQQRTLAIALKLAQGEALRERGGKTPIYLLDDVFGELDPTRRNALMQALPEDAQKLITTTTLDWLDESWGDWARFQVCGGSANRV